MVRASITRSAGDQAERDGIRIEDIFNIVRRPPVLVANPRYPREQCVVRGNLPDRRPISIVVEPRFFDDFSMYADWVLVIDYRLGGAR